MPRTTPALVRGILTARPTIDLDPAIETANALVTERCAPVLQADGVTPFHSAARLELIERYLAAHFACFVKRRTSQEIAGKVQASYQGKVDLGFNFTEYGQHAMLLDTSGSLAALNAGVQDASGVLPESGWGTGSVFTGRPDYNNLDNNGW